MDVIFRTKKLEKCYKSYELGCRAWGFGEEAEIICVEEVSKHYGD